MKKMTMKDAVMYCTGHDAVIHTPTQEIYDNLMNYLDILGYRWATGKSMKGNPQFFTRNVCINCQDKFSVMKSDRDYYINLTCEIIELLPEYTPMTITIKSDGHKVVSAECNGIIAEARCMDTDVFRVKNGSHRALQRLLDKLDSPLEPNEFKVGDIVEILRVGNGAPEETIGLQGIIKEEMFKNVFEVKFLKKIDSLDEWSYTPKHLKLICRV
jgi:hypothetical protein